jgi:hypothetical protein
MLICATDNGGNNGRETVLIKKKLDVILDSLFALCISKIDFDGTRYLNTSKLSNSYSQLHGKRYFSEK